MNIDAQLIDRIAKNGNPALGVNQGYQDHGDVTHNSLLLTERKEQGSLFFHDCSGQMNPPLLDQAREGSEKEPGYPGVRLHKNLIQA